jgi:hypothetical protein
MKLCLFAIARLWQCDDSEHARAHPLGDSFDNTPFPCRVASLENYDDAQALVFDPFLQMTQFDLETVQLSIKNLSRYFAACFCHPFLFPVSDFAQHYPLRSWREMAPVVIFAAVTTNTHFLTEVGSLARIRFL